MGSRRFFNSRVRALFAAGISRIIRGLRWSHPAAARALDAFLMRLLQTRRARVSDHYYRRIPRASSSSSSLPLHKVININLGRYRLFFSTFLALVFFLARPPFTLPGPIKRDLMSAEASLFFFRQTFARSNFRVAVVITSSRKYCKLLSRLPYFIIC